jgi:hypothetical protein
MMTPERDRRIARSVAVRLAADLTSDRRKDLKLTWQEFWKLADEITEYILSGKHE